MPSIFYVPNPVPVTENEGKLFLVPKLSGPLLAGVPLKSKE